MEGDVCSWNSFGTIGTTVTIDSIYAVDPSQECQVACAGRCLVLEAEFRSI
jgi:hypothetical protein